ncbi:MAG: site-specific integrase [Bacteroidia bacterium]|nr:site-specific integrase [Bacteroidia bacterium]
MTTNKKIYSPDELKVYDAGGDISKRWFIHYQELGKRKKVYGDINRFKNAEDRYAAIQILKSKLLHPNAKRTAVASLLYEYLEHKKSTLRRKTWMDYSSKFKTFEEFYKGGVFTPLHAEEFSDFLLEVKSLHTTTHNDYIRLMRGAFSWLVKRGKFKINPFKNTDYKKSVSTPALYFQPYQIEELREAILEKDPGLWLFVQFVYYCFVRPGELRFMKASDILWEDRLLLMRPEVSKNKKQQYVRIPDAFYPKLYKAFHGCKSGNYLFGKDGLPGPGHLSYNTMGNRHRKILRSLKYPKGYMLYSWKHTGAVMAVKAGIHIKQLQIQLRHHSLDQVDQYLRDLGVSDLSDLARSFPGI